VSDNSLKQKKTGKTGESSRATLKTRN